jgi:putative FmdB family regulatory protein
MPIYAFHCESCGHQFDRLQRLADADPQVCPACGAAAVKRSVTAPAFRLAGSGWYETDFKKDGQRNVVHKDEPVATTPAAPTTPATAETRPAVKPATTGGNASD